VPRRSLLLLAGLLVVGAVLVVPAGRADAQPNGERITDYVVAMSIERDGTLLVDETITYDFGTNERRGILRDLVRTERFDGDHDRRYDIDVLGVSADPGTPDDVQLSSEGDYLRIRIGDPDQTITGEHTYEIAYSVAGALLPFGDHDELNWDAIGNQWPVPIDRASARVGAPAPITGITCFSGPAGSRASCDESAMDGVDAVFAQSGLAPGSGLTVVVGVPKGAIAPEPAPILEERRTLGDAFAVTPVTGGVAGGIAALGLVGVGAVAWRQGRDRRFTGSAVDAAMGNLTGEEERVGLGDDDAGPVEFVPPDGVRPGQVGTLIDEQANLLDVTATIVDLAVRGHLHITEVDGERHADYELARTEGGKGELTSYERELYHALFESGPTVKLSDLKYNFTTQLSSIRNALYDDAVANGWYRVRPDHTRLWWRLIGVGIAVIGVVLTVVTAVISSFGLIPLAIVVVGVALLAVGGRMPARTGKGSAMLSRIGGFRRLFDEGEEDTRQRFAEQQGIFSQYLPYAIVFGATKKWARAFEGLDAEQLGAASWYTGHNTFTAFALASAMDDFDTSATGTMYASQPSSSSASGFSGGGFSGGGGGGGGGGSW
jgi:uncharacterized membrane protein YgcG